MRSCEVNFPPSRGLGRNKLASRNPILGLTLLVEWYQARRQSEKLASIERALVSYRAANLLKTDKS